MFSEAEPLLDTVNAIPKSVAGVSFLAVSAAGGLGTHASQTGLDVLIALSALAVGSARASSHMIGNNQIPLDPRSAFLGSNAEEAKKNFSRNCQQFFDTVGGKQGPLEEINNALADKYKGEGSNAGAHKSFAATVAMPLDETPSGQVDCMPVSSRVML